MVKPETLHWATRRHVETYHQDGECTIYALDCNVLTEIEAAHAEALELNEEVNLMTGCHVIEGCTSVAQHGGNCRVSEADAAKGSRLTIHTAGELHDTPEIGRVTFTYNLSDLLDDPAHKPGAELIELDGTNIDVQDFVFQSKGALELFEDIVDTVARQLSRKDIVVLFLCRGGKHRSVAFGEALAYHFDVRAVHHHRHLPRVIDNVK